jgi:hypothetical protein
LVDYKKGCTRLAAASDKVYQLLAHGRWFSPDTPASSTTKTGRGCQPFYDKLSDQQVHDHEIGGKLRKKIRKIFYH